MIVNMSNTCGAARRVFLLSLLATVLLSLQVSALSYVAGSKCEAVCSDKNAGTVHDDVRCLDNEFDDVPASRLRECVTCQLGSTAVDPLTKMTDVQWGLFHLRYILANCMFAYPEERVSISSPCQVSCAPLKRAVTFGISNSTNTTDFSGDLGFCTGGQFDDVTINNCAFCYSFIPQQLILGNFLQALHIACNKAPTIGKSFSPDGVAIFNQSTIAGPVGEVVSSGGGGLTGTTLVLVIVLPLVGGIGLLCGCACCCWHFTRKRRALAANGRRSKYHDDQQMQDFSPMSPLPMTPHTSPPQPYTGMWNEPPQEMHSISAMHRMAEPKTAAHNITEVAELPVSREVPGHAQPRWPQFKKDDSSISLPSRDDETSENMAPSEATRSNAHEHDFNAQRRDNPPVDTFHAQDGFVQEHSQGGWAR